MTLADRVLEIARIPAPTFAERRRLEWLETTLAGAPGRRHRDEAGNLVWRLGEGRPRLLLLVHVDTVFPEQTELRFARSGDKAIGPGIGDNAAAVAVTLDAVSAVLAAGVPRPLAVAFTVGEEGLGDLVGARAACASLRPELAIAVEGHGLDQVLVDCVGSVRLRVEVRGPGGHSWVDRGRPSAVHALVRAASELVSAWREDMPVNVGVISGGRSVNTIADRGELLVEARSLGEEPLERFAEAVQSLRADAPLEVSVETVGRRPAGRLDRAHPLLSAVRAVRSELDLPDQLGEGSTDANAALALGIPAVTIGVARGGGMHTLEEYIEVSTLAAGRAQLVGILQAVLAGDAG
jgi:tripeptide aminopeptidase